MKNYSASQAPTIRATLAYAAPLFGTGFFYMPMWSVLPGVYAKYFGLPLTSIAACVLCMRLFDGFIDTTVGYLSDVHRAAGGLRRTWVLIGGVGSVIACYFLFTPPQPVTAGYYLVWSLIYFLAFTMLIIPHGAWGNELTMDYAQRTRVFGIANMVLKAGNAAFYVLPLLPIYASTEYTPRVLTQSVYVGGAVTLVGLTLTALAAPAGVLTRTASGDSLITLTRSIARNRPLLIYIGAFACAGLAYGMWFGLLYFYLDTYLKIGDRVAITFLVGLLVAVLSMPAFVHLIGRTSKTTAWLLALLMFIVQLLACVLLQPGITWWIPFSLIVIGLIGICWHDTAAAAVLGDIIDYGKLKFYKDRAATYSALSALTYKIGLGVGGGIAIGVAGLFGVDPTHELADVAAIHGLQIGFLILPAALTFVAALFVATTPINRRRHLIIQQRLENRSSRSCEPPYQRPGDLEVEATR